jgi:hypothetical protein
MSKFEQLANNPKKSILFLFLLSAILFIGLGNTHLFDWDEINFAESAREMMASGDYLRVQINFEPFWEKPPLFFWLQVVSMKLFGVNEFAARFPNAVFGFIYLISFYFIGKKHFSAKFGLMWSLIFFATILPHIYFKSGIIDPVFNYFIFMSIYFMILVISGDHENKMHLAFIAGLFSGLSVITKGPVGFLLLGLTLLVYLIIKKFKPFPKVKFIAGFFFGLLVIIFTWLGVEFYNNGTAIIQKFIEYQAELFSSDVAGHAQPFYYHFVVVFFGCFPISILALPLLFKRRWNVSFDFHTWMLCLFWVVLILFSIVTTKIIHYSSMTWIPLSFMAALTVYEVSLGEYYFKKSIRIAFITLGVLIGTAILAVPIILMNKEILTSRMEGGFALDSLSQNIPWSGFEISSGLIFIAGIILAAVYLKKNKIVHFVMTMTGTTTIALLLAQFMIIPKVEQITQGAAISYYKDLKGKDCYVECYGFKSYAQYFYKEQKPGLRPIQKTSAWFLEGKIDKPLYLITKSDYLALDEWNNFKLIKNKGGFRLYKREVGAFKEVE